MTAEEMIIEKMTVEELTAEKMKKDYYSNRPSEPYGDNEEPESWAKIAFYAEENLVKAFKQIANLKRENKILKEKIALIIK